MKRQASSYKGASASRNRTFCSRKFTDKKIIFGLTGSFGSGKTYVAQVLKAYGAAIIDADKIAHGLLKPGTCVYKKVVRAFGNEILRKDKSIDRARLGVIVFGNRRLLKNLNAIVHPEVIRIIRRDIRAIRHKPVVLDAPLLIEAGLHRLADKLIVVKLNRVKQIARLRRKTSLPLADIKMRINAQMPLEDKVRLADFVIDNNGTREETRMRVETIWNKIATTESQKRKL